MSQPENELRAAIEGLIKLMFSSTHPDVEVRKQLGYAANLLEGIRVRYLASRAPATTPTHKRPLVEYDKNSPVVKALEAAHDEWVQGNCHEVGCGCWTVIANNHLAPVLASQASATTPTPAESYAVGPAELWLADISLRCPKCASPALTSNNKREHRCLHCLTKCTDETALPSVRSLIDKAVENALAQAAAPGGKESK